MVDEVYKITTRWGGALLSATPGPCAKDLAVGLGLMVSAVVYDRTERF